MSGNLHMFRVGKDGDWTTLWVSLDHGGDGGIQIQLSSQWGAFAHYFDQPGKCTLAWLADCDDGYMERKLYASAVRCGVADRKAETAAARAIRAWPALVHAMRTTAATCAAGEVGT